MRKTSAETYRQIESEGLLSGLRMIVYKTLYHHGPLTQMELCRKVGSDSIQDRSLMPRFAELEDMKCIAPFNERVCNVTGRKVLEWDVTEKLPTKTKKERVKPREFYLLKSGLWMERSATHMQPTEVIRVREILK